jgi:hypothetical protein
MSTVHETIYPVLPAEPGAAELKAAFTPSTAEIRFVRRQSRQEATAVLIMVQLKLLQRLGYFPMLVDVPPVIIDHIRTAMRARTLSRTAIARYDVSGSRIRHQKLLRAWLDIRAFDAGETTRLTERASAQARTKVELPDIINVLIEELVGRRYELPPLATLQRIATRARNDLNEAIYGAITGALDATLTERIDALLVVRAGKSGWDDLKQEPKRPAARAIASFLKHINGIRKLAEGLPAPPAILSVSKRAQLVAEARALDIAELRSLKAAKRHALAVLFIQAQLQKALDDVAEIFIKVVRKRESYARSGCKNTSLSTPMCWRGWSASSGTCSRSSRTRAYRSATGCRRSARRSVTRPPRSSSATSTLPTPASSTCRSCSCRTATSARCCSSVWMCCRCDRARRIARYCLRSPGCKASGTRTANICC